MARQARKKSETGIYHVMLRGVNHQTIFRDGEDFLKYLRVLRDYQDKSGYTIYAYCLMSNHIHLLIKEGEEGLGTAFKRIGSAFVYWYNCKYGRIGNLFQGRYKSEVVENDQYFQTVIRYIHQNPLKAGIVDDIRNYRWSSYNEYINKPELCYIEFALNMLSSDRSQARGMFKDFNNTTNEDQCLDFDQPVRLRDSEAKEIIIKIGGVSSPTEMTKFDKARQSRVIRACKDCGLSLRQISRLTGISMGVIRNI